MRHLIFNEDRVLEDITDFELYADSIFHRFCALYSFFGLDLEETYCKECGV